MKTQLYEVNTADDKTHLIKATKKSIARKFVCDKYVGAVMLATPERTAELVSSGIKVEEAIDS